MALFWWPLIVMFCEPFLSIAQEIKSIEINGVPVKAVVSDSDTLPVVVLEPFRVVDYLPYNNKKLDKKFRRILYHVRKVYPYAKLAGELMRAYNDTLMHLSPKERKAYLKKAEKQLIAEFRDDIESMTYTQGVILLKLIDRETGNTSYDLIKELRGSVQAFFWQQIGRLFDINLKEGYDPVNNIEDNMIERAIQIIEEENQNKISRDNY